MTDHPRAKHVRDLAVLLDSKFEGPFGFRFGLDGLLGFIPVIGDFVTTGLSLYIIITAASLGAAPSVILRMGLNVLLENLMDMIPGLGNLFDFYWKSNTKNLALLEAHLHDPQGSRWRARLVLGFICFLLLFITVGTAAVTMALISKLVLR